MREHRRTLRSRWGFVVALSGVALSATEASAQTAVAPAPSAEPAPTNPPVSAPPPAGYVAPAYPSQQQITVEPLTPANAPIAPAGPGAPPPSGAPYPLPPIVRSGPKPPSRGFQFAVRTGVSFPLGDATGTRNDALSRRYAWQVPIVLDLGVKVHDAFFIGGYLGAAFGAEGSDSAIEAYCRDDDDNFRNDISCSAFTFQIGIQAHYSFEPGGAWNPWIGYGFGWEVAEQTITDDNRSYRESTTVKGLTVAKLMVGADYRAGVGIGPYLEAAIGRYSQSRTEVNDDETHSGTIPEQAFHTWLTFGLRMTVNP